MALSVSPGQAALHHPQNFCQPLWLNQRSWGHRTRGLGNLPEDRDGTSVWLLNEAEWGMSLQHPQFPAGLEVTDEVLEKAAGTDVNNM